MMVVSPANFTTEENAVVVEQEGDELSALGCSSVAANSSVVCFEEVKYPCSECLICSQNECHGEDCVTC